MRNAYHFLPLTTAIAGGMVCVRGGVIGMGLTGMALGGSVTLHHRSRMN